MRVAVISHACIVPANQQTWADFAQLPQAEVTLIVPKRWRSDLSAGSYQLQRLPAYAGRLCPLPVAWSGNVPLHFYLRSLGACLSSLNPDIVFLDEEPYGLCAWQVARAQSRKRSSMVFYTKQNIRKDYLLPFAMIERLVYRRSARAVAITDEVKSVLCSKGYKKPIDLLPHGVDAELFQRREESTLRRQLGLTGTVMGYIGRLVEEKGLRILLESVHLLQESRRLTQASVLLVGSGPLEAKIRAFVRNEGLEEVVRCHPSVPHDQAHRYLNCMDIMVLPSLTMPRWKEQFGRVIIESLACEVPVVGSDSGSIPYLIGDTGGGLVTRENDAQDLAEKLALLLRDADRRRALAEQGRRVVLERYTHTAVARQLYGIFEETLAR